MSGDVLQTEFEFTLPQGYADDDGTLHREGVMRLATAADEIKPLQDPRVQSNESYLTVVLLARTVTELGTLETVDESVIEELFVNDLEYLQRLYERVNDRGANVVTTACPDCGEQFDVDAESGAHVAREAATPSAPSAPAPDEADLGAVDAGAAQTGDADDAADADEEREEVEAGNSTE